MSAPDPALEITPTAPIRRSVHGWRSKCLQRLIRIGLPVPTTFAIPVGVVRRIAAGQLPPREMLTQMIRAADGLLAVRPSAVDPDWGGPGTVLNVGINDSCHSALARRIGGDAADRLYLNFVQSYAVNVARLDPDAFAQEGEGALAAALAAFRGETGEGFPQDPAQQLAEVLRSMARAWDGPSARLLREAKGAPADAPLGLVVQDMAIGLGPGLTGSGTIQFVDPVTGGPRISGRFLGQTQGRIRGEGASELYLAPDARGPALQQAAAEIFDELVRAGEAVRRRLREEMRIDYVLTEGKLSIIDAVKVQRSARAAVKIAVALARDGVIPPEEAVMRVEPRAITDLLHPQVDPRAPRDAILRGIGASPGAATGRIVFSSARAQEAAARGEACILVRRETTPEDVRGMHAARGVLTERGGMTSHAAVIARGFGLPCIVSAAGLHIDARSGWMMAGKRRFLEGEEITIDGTSGEVLAGAAELLPPAVDDDFRTLLAWADAACDMVVRANADSPAEARAALGFGAQGIGLARTEHMFFEADRLPAIQEMVFAHSAQDRRLALERILPMQRADFAELFGIMAGLPVCIRLFDPPLHEFLPQDREGMRELAETLDRPLSDVVRRIEAVSEANPMLGMRGVRLGLAVPEIYDMQARAIFEATIDAARDGAPVVPEIMIPLVSAMREVEIVKTRIDAVAAAVRNQRRTAFDYRLGVMVETPRACLRAGDIAAHASFISFGTNDLTQMTYGLSRDDAGRFMGTYVAQGVWPEDPFHILDQDGVGELILTGATRARESRPAITLSVCGEHGGNPESIAFCRRAGLDYVSCSPFRVPVARLAAAQESIRSRLRGDSPAS
ncbi:pyruvate, phosphate dikinase [Paracoccus sp. S-4012]|uniref:putative PEP-binding protein n=1 Tax=Paracoccus sp. S-4012 TaxID=2665648 RepID=UPI0012AFD8A8|nr:putative PEP-binding protein [Paracoccus sp. S-4012]MRX51856.1 pyruvate, phosphate dikinase [Paracoccus sp. S-4012]